MAKLPRKLLIVALVVASLPVAVACGFRLAAAQRERSPATALVPSNGRFVETPEGRLFVSITGPAAAPAVIMTHGVAAWGGLWSETAAVLGANGFRVYAVDLPPFGFSDRPADGNYSRAAQARRLLALADALALARPAIVGHSYGGGPAMEAVLQAPTRFGRIVLVAPVLGIDEPRRSLATPLRLAAVRELVVALTATNLLATRRLLASFMHRKDHAYGRYVDIVQRPMARSGTTEAIATWSPELFQADPTALSARSGAYSGLAVPLRLIWGTDDTVTPLPQGRRVQALVPGAMLDLLPGVGHMPQLEDPPAFQAALLAALASPPRSR